MEALKKEKLYTADEFLAMTDLPECCELLDGIIYEMSAAPNLHHQDITGSIHYAVSGYIRKHKGSCRVYTAPCDVRINDSNVVQPDIYVVCDRDKLDGQKCVGAPDWVIEVLSPSSVARDTEEKMNLYHDAGVKEYWIVNPINKRVTVYIFGIPNIIGFYTFDDDIPVGIYKDCPEPLSIRISALLPD